MALVRVDTSLIGSNLVAVVSVAVAIVIQAERRRQRRVTTVHEEMQDARFANSNPMYETVRFKASPLYEGPGGSHDYPRA